MSYVQTIAEWWVPYREDWLTAEVAPSELGSTSNLDQSPRFIIMRMYHSGTLLLLEHPIIFIPACALGTDSMKRISSQLYTHC